MIELTPVAYEYPGIALAGDWDANWLVIEGHVTTADASSWSFRDPSLTTWDAAELGTWLRGVATSPSGSSSASS